jgi:hypothetical protein
MRSRNIKPGFFKNEILGMLDPLIQLTFEGLWMLADKRGRLEDRPIRIKGELFPYREGVDVNGYLTVLEREGFITRYVVDGAALIQVLNFEKHQSPHHTERESKLPAPPCKNIDLPPNGELTVKPPLEYGESTQAKRSDSLIPDSLIPDKTSSSELVCSSDEATTPTQQKITRLPSQQACRLSALLKSEILRNKPNCRITAAQERNWAVTAQRMLDRDKRSSEQIEKVIRWAQRDEFWMANVLSMESLRKKFDQLELKMGLDRQSSAASATKLPATYVPASEKILQERRAGGVQ